MALPEPAQRLLAGRPVTHRRQHPGHRRPADAQAAAAGPAPGRRGAAARARAVRCCATTTAHTAGDQPIGSVRSLRVADLPARLYVPDGRAGGGTAAGLLPRRGLLVRRPRQPRRAPAGSSPSRPGSGCCRWTTGSAPSTRSRRRTTTPPRRTPGPWSTPPSWGPTRPGSASAATRPAATSPRASRSRRPGTGGRAPCSCSSTRPPRPGAETRSAELFARGLLPDPGVHGPGRRALRRRRTRRRPAALAAAGRAAGRPGPGARLHRRRSTRCATRARRTPTGCARPGVEVELTRFDDQIHGFFNIVGVGRTSRAANLRIAARAGFRVVLNRDAPVAVTLGGCAGSSPLVLAALLASAALSVPAAPCAAPGPASAGARPARGRCSSVTPTSSAAAAAPTRSRTWPSWPAPSSATGPIVRGAGGTGFVAANPEYDIPPYLAQIRDGALDLRNPRAGGDRRAAPTTSGGRSAQIRRRTPGRSSRIARDEVPDAHCWSWSGRWTPTAATPTASRSATCCARSRKQLDVPFVDDMKWTAGHDDVAVRRLRAPDVRGPVPARPAARRRR